MPLHTRVAFDHWKLPGNESVQALPEDICPLPLPVSASLSRARHAPRADAEAQLQAVLHGDRPAQECVGRDAEIGLVERELSRYADAFSAGLDLRRYLQRARHAVQRDRQRERRL